MGLRQLVICTEDDEVLFAGTSQTSPPSDTHAVAEALGDRPTLPTPPIEGDYADDAPTLLRSTPRR